MGPVQECLADVQLPQSVHPPGLRRSTRNTSNRYAACKDEIQLTDVTRKYRQKPTEKYLNSFLPNARGIFAKVPQCLLAQGRRSGWLKIMDEGKRCLGGKSMSSIRFKQLQKSS